MNLSLSLATGAFALFTGLIASRVAQSMPLPNPGAPAVFAGLAQVQTVNASKVRLSWDNATVPNAFAFNVYDVSNDSPVLLGTVHGNLSTLTVSSLSTATLYKFRVRAVGQDGLEDLNTNDLPGIAYGGISQARVINSTAARVEFADASGADAVDIYCHSRMAPLDVLMAEIKDTTQNSTTLKGLTTDEPYICRAMVKIGNFTDNNSITYTFTPSGVATNLVFTSQPGNTVVGRALNPSPVVKILDADGNLVAAGPDSTAMITLTISTSSVAAVLRGTNTVTAVNGIATFSGLFIQEIGEMELTATKSDTTSSSYGSPGITAESAPFTIKGKSPKSY